MTSEEEQVYERFLAYWERMCDTYSWMTPLTGIEKAVVKCFIQWQSRDEVKHGQT